MNMKCLGVLALVFAASTSGAQVTASTPNRALTIDNVGSGLPYEQRKTAEETARLITENVLKASKGEKAQAIAQDTQKVARRVDAIADASLSADRDKVFKFLGINPDGDTSLYYFVTFEMPVEVLRAYVVEAMWTGGTLVFKGIPEGRELRDFITNDMMGLVYGKGASAALSIDPRLFDAYQITVAPTIVLTKDRTNFNCLGINPKQFTYGGEAHTYDTCPPLDESKYWKISGAVTTDFALREFMNNGAAVEAKPYLDALAKGFATGTIAPKAQQPYAGEWKDAITPDELMAVKRAVEAASGAASPLQTAPGVTPK